MKFAVVGGERREAVPGLSGRCPGCDADMVARCGEYRVWHWAHRQKRVCDRWWEPETEWHRSWKNEFPVAWQECFQRAEDGERHIADVKTEHGRVIEFQHSFLKPQERRAREAFYARMVWVVDGLRRKTDMPRFFDALRAAKVVRQNPLILCVPWNEGALLRDWGDSGAPVLFDFGDATDVQGAFRTDRKILWHLDPTSPQSFACLAPVWRTGFVEALRAGTPYTGIPAASVLTPYPLPLRRLHGFDRHLIKRRRARF